MPPTPTLQPGLSPVDGMSWVRGASDAPLSSLTIDRLLRAASARHAERAAVVFREQGVRWTWREFAVEVDAVASGLLQLGLQPGDRLGIWSPNRAEWLLTQFATARIGVILVNINPAYRLAELEYALKVSGCRAIVAAEGVSSLFKGAGANILRGIAGAGVLSGYDKLQEILFGKVYKGGSG